MTDSTQQTRIIPLTEWNNHHSWPPIGGLRHLVFYADVNGFDNVILRAGRRVLIDEAAFFHWLRKGNEKLDKLSSKNESLYGG